MTPIVWVLIGAGAWFLATLILSAVLDIETREALARVVSLPIAGPVWLLARHLERLPRAGQMRAAGIVEEFTNGRFEKVAWGVAGRRWAVVMVRRIGDELPPKPERVP